MSRGGKPALQAKRVAPPAVPDAFCPPSPGPHAPCPGTHGQHGQHGHAPGTGPHLAPPGPAHRHSGSSFGSSQGYASSEDALMQPPDTPVASIRGNLLLIMCINIITALILMQGGI